MWICTVTVSDELKVFRQLCEMAESHPHGEDAGADAACVRYPVTDNGSACGIHDESDISLDATDLDVRFIGGEDAAGSVIVVIDKGLDADGGGFAIVGDLLV